MLALGPGLLLLAGFGGMLLARRAFRPVTQITQTASSISATDLQRRVPVGKTHDELNELAVTFNAMIERLESAVARERRFTADASHELRSPLAVILAEASLALEEPLSPEDYRHVLGVVQEQAKGMHEMIAALLTLARVEVIQGPREPVAIAAVIERALRQCAPVMAERSVRIESTLEPDLWVEGNETLLARAVRNVIDNALKASPASSTVRISGVRAGGLLMLRIQDQGPGIPEEDLTRIFEPFYQVEKARTPGDSHGLGLAICRRIVYAHGGEVTAASPPDGGACISIMLPGTDSSMGAARREVA